MVATNSNLPGSRNLSSRKRTGTHPEDQELDTQNERLKAALAYRRHGHPVTLCEEKTPQYNGWPSKAWTDGEIESWFTKNPGYNVGIVLGPRSNIIDIEEDGPGAEAELLALFDSDVPVTPTYRSCRGKHRLFKWHSELEQADKAVVKFGDLEVRIGGISRGLQSLVPPSVTDGFSRVWEPGLSLSECNPADVPPAVIKRILDKSNRRCSAQPAVPTNGHVTQGAQDTQVTHDMPGCPVPPVCQRVALAIEATLPAEGECNHYHIFAFARHLKAIPELAHKKAKELEEFIKMWHDAAVARGIPIKEFDHTRDDFNESWRSVKYPYGTGPLDELYRRSLKRHPPPCACKYDSKEYRSLVGLCRELQIESGDKPFFLAGRQAAEVLELKHRKVARMLRTLAEDDEVLERLTSGEPRKAAEYRFVAEMGDITILGMAV